VGADAAYWIGLSLLPGIGPQRLRRIAEAFENDLERAWHASSETLIRAGVEPSVVRTALSGRSAIDLAATMRRIEQAGARVHTLVDSSYPARLAEIYDAPPVLYTRGAFAPEDEWAVAVVGTRNVTAYGREVTQRLVADLVRNNVTIVSGLARGVDGLAHRAALEAGGRTLAVFASGVDVIYPPEHRRLAEDIAHSGALLSEYPIGSQPEAGNFPARNRIISGLSLGTIVIEAGEKSGALITAQRALEQDREVFAVPGSILSPRSMGTNRLIRDSAAKLILSADDVLEELRLQLVPQQLEMRRLLPENETESRLIALLSHEPVHIDELTRRSTLPASDVSSTLAIMELKGLVRQVGGMQYVVGA
jgi:DNA processing protein